MGTPVRAAVTVAAAALPTLTGGAASGAASTPAPADDAPVTVEVAARRVWTATGVRVHTGDTVTVEASGRVDFGYTRALTDVSPAGRAWGPQCIRLATRGAAWPAPGLRCWSLIGRVGAGAPFDVGTGTTFRADTTGELRLGVNDHLPADNAGRFTATVTVTPAAGAEGTGAAAEATASDAGGGGGNSLPLVAAAAGLIAAAGGATWLLRRRARRPARFELSPQLRVGRVDCRITRDRVIHRLESGGIEAPFSLHKHDFAPVGVQGEHPTFSWHGLEFRAQRAGPFCKPAGHVVLPGGLVAGSAGVMLSPDGRTVGLVPATLPGAWVFALAADDGGGAHDHVDGHVTMFVRDDRPFAPQGDALTKSFGNFLADLDVLLSQRTARAAEPAGARRR
jgi:hypothetical protein